MRCTLIAPAVQHEPQWTPSVTGNNPACCCNMNLRWQVPMGEVKCNEGICWKGKQFINIGIEPLQCHCCSGHVQECGSMLTMAYIPVNMHQQDLAVQQCIVLGKFMTFAVNNSEFFQVKKSNKTLVRKEEV